jgi:hypothetical protein
MRIPRIIAFVLFGVSLVSIGILGACASKSKQELPPPAPTTALINIINGENARGLGALYGGEFSPRNVTISIGGTVTWNNTDSVHGTQNVISNDGLFNKSLEYGESFSYTFTQNGSFNYHDDLHDNMDGTVIVR